MGRAAVGGDNPVKWLLLLFLVGLSSWHLWLMHEEHQVYHCPPQVRCLRDGGSLRDSIGNDSHAAAAPVALPRQPSSASGEVKKSDKGGPAELPFYDVVTLIMATGSKNDRKRMDAADKTWLKQMPSGMSFTYFYALCHDDPAVNCEEGSKGCIRDRHAVVVLPCKHGYKFLTSKSIEGYRYIVQNYRFKYVFKVDADSLMDLQCLEKSIQHVDAKCRSFGMGLWRVAGDSRVIAGHGSKYDNAAFMKDTGAAVYPSYMTGWALLWSADVVRFLGMAGAPNMPHWRETWTIDDAAIGTFVMGLDICHLPLTCPVWTEQSGEDIESIWKFLNDKDAALNVGPGNSIEGFKGPFADDVPDLGDLYNVQASSLGHCAILCSSNRKCRSFEFSATAGKEWRDRVKNCQIATGTNRAGKQWRDFKLYLKK